MKTDENAVILKRFCGHKCFLFLSFCPVNVKLFSLNQWIFLVLIFRNTLHGFQVKMVSATLKIPKALANEEIHLSSLFGRVQNCF